MNSLKEIIRKSLQVEDISKKTIAISLEENLINDIKKITDVFSEINGSKSFTRNSLIEDAIKNYVREAKDILKNEFNIDVDNDIYENKKLESESKFDTVIFPAHNDGFESTFLVENCWYPVRVNENKIPFISYVAIYRAAPVSAITHFAKVKSIAQYKGTDKKIIYFEGNPIELKTPIKLGDINASSMRSPRYTTKDKLLKSKIIKELF